MVSHADSDSGPDLDIVAVVPPCRCGRQCLYEAVWIEGEEDPRCHECLCRLVVSTLPRQDRLVAIVLLVIWSRQRYRWGV